MKSSSIPPPTQYRDDPSHTYRDIPTTDDEENVPSIFDWGDSSSAPSEPVLTSSGGGGGRGGKQKKAPTNSSTSFDPNVEIPFTPISLHDDEDEDDDSDISGSNNLRPHNGFLGNVVSNRHRHHEYGPVGIHDDDTENNKGRGGRLFVGGGWGRHGSSNNNCCSCQQRRRCSCFGIGGTGCLLVLFLTLTFLCGYLGYEAGLPVTTLDSSSTTTTNTDGTTTTTTLANDNHNDDDGFETTQHTMTHGDQWLEWLQKETKEHFHLPHLQFNFTRHNPIITTNTHTNQVELSFPPMNQAELLGHSEHIFQSCSERSLATQVGRTACLSLCHGHYCCFEKDVEFGSCVATANSYCFVYAACENVVMDFGFTNINTEDGTNSHKKKMEGGSVDVDGLNREDLELLEETCSKENVVTLEGIRDCNAFCQHHLCCFSDDEGENCQADHKEECEAYESCRIIADGPEDDGGSKSGSGGGGSKVGEEGGSITVTPEQVEKAVFDACYFGEDESRVTQGLVEQCHNICSSRYCCFESQTIVSSCRDTVGEEECKLYSLCEQMINERGEEVKNFIELDKLEFGLGSSSISSTIAPLSATSAGQISSSNAGSGTSYRPGSNGVFIDESEFEATLNEVKAACSPDQSGIDESWVAGCHAMCADYMCCFATDGTGSNCKDVHGEDVCEAYAGCKVLQSASSSQQQQQPQQQNDQSEQAQLDEMEETCVPKIRRDANLRERCRKVCAPRDCCWQSGPGNCYVMNTDWCDEFSMCEILVV